MPLTACPDCNTEVSDQATACVKCGRPMAKKVQPYQPKPVSSSKAIFWTVAGLIIAGMLYPSFMRGYNNQQAKSGSKNVSQAVETIRKKNAAMQYVNLEYTWEKGGFDSVLMLDLTIRNRGKEFIKDVEITCDSKANSGTAIDSNKRVVYEAVAPDFHKTVKDFSMGFIANQVGSTDCRITDLVVF